MTYFLFDYTSWDDWRSWLDAHAVRLLVIAVLLLAVHWLFRRVFSQLFGHAVARAASVRRGDPAALQRRVSSFSATLNWALGLLLMFIGAGLVLAEFGLNVSALIAGVGVVGIALGLGAQTLVKDVINGLFILLEDQYAVGDVVQIGGVSGQVIELTPRRTVLRDVEGNIHIVPNSSITIATNMTQGCSRIHLDVSVACEQDVERVVETINEVGEALAAERKEDIIVVPKVLRVSRTNERIDITLTADVKALKQREITEELRRRLEKRFDEQGIKVPIPAE